MQYIRLGPYVFLSLIIAVPTLSGFYHLFFTSLYSPIHFQQGIRDFSCWKSAFAITVIAVSPLVCLLPLGISSFYVLYSSGYIISVLLSAIVITPVLHYIPSPSICQYYPRRFHNHCLSLFVVTVNVAIAFVFAVCLLVFSTSLTATISHYSIIILCPLLGYLAIFSTIFAGQASVSSPTCLVSFVLISLGIGILLYNGIEELTGFLSEEPDQYSLLELPSAAYFFTGCIVGLYFITSSPICYQQYFALYDKHQLRWTFLLHLLLFAISVFSLSSISFLYEQNLATNSTNGRSFIQLIHFFKASVPYPSILPIFASLTVFVITFFSFTLTILSLSTTLWENILRSCVKQWSQVRQLCILQVLLFVAGTLVICCSTVILEFLEVFLSYFPNIFVLLSCLASPLSAASICAFLYPAVNGKGAMIGMFTGYLVIVSLLLLQCNHTWLYTTESINHSSSLNLINNGQNTNGTFSLASDNLTLESPNLSQYQSTIGNITALDTADRNQSTDANHPLFITLCCTDCTFALFLPLVAFLVAVTGTIGASFCSEDGKGFDPNLVVNSFLTKSVLPQRISELTIQNELVTS